VSGVTGPISELRISLFSVYHDRPEDMDVLIVSPTGKSVIVMSDAGSSFPIPGDSAVDLTFLDSATKDLPETARITPGLYRPTNYDQDDFFPDPAPFAAPTDTDIMALAADDPNGEWLCYVVDDTYGNIGGVGGWGLTFVTGAAGPAAPSTPDMHPSSDRGAFNNDNVTNNNTPVFTGTAPAGTSQVRLFVDGVAHDVGPVTSGKYQIQITGGLTDGTHAISARGIDAQSNEGDVSGDLMVTIDTVIPDTPSTPDLTPDSDTGASNSDNDTTDTTPTFTGTAPDATTLQLVANNLPVGSTPISNGTYTVTVTNPMAVGTYEFNVFSSDLAGNASSLSQPLTVVIRQGTVTTPKISDVYARGSTWAPPDNNAGNLTFMEYLQSQGMGNASMGYKLTAGTSLPWTNVDQLVLHYDAPLTAAPPASGIVVHGQRSDYTVATALLDNQTVRVTLPRALGNLPGGGDNGDRITLTVAGAGPGGAAYTLNFLVLQGDVDRNGSVLANDYSAVKSRFFKNTNSATTGTNDYSPFMDADGNGSILANDYSAVKARFFHSLPPAAGAAAAVIPARPRFGATRIAADVLA